MNDVWYLNLELQLSTCIRMMCGTESREDSSGLPAHQQSRNSNASHRQQSILDVKDKIINDQLWMSLGFNSIRPMSETISDISRRPCTRSYASQPGFFHMQLDPQQHKRLLIGLNEDNWRLLFFEKGNELFGNEPRNVSQPEESPYALLSLAGYVVPGGWYLMGASPLPQSMEQCREEKIGESGWARKSWPHSDSTF